MRRLFAWLTAFVFFITLSALPALAQHGGGGAGHAGGAGMGGGSSMGPGMGGSMGQGQAGSMGRGSDMGGSHMGNNSMGNTPNEHSVSSSSPTNLLSSNTKLNSTLQERLGSMLPSGMSLTDAASGFKNLGQFIAALHVSHNLDIPFSDLKDKITSGDNLGKAIHAFKPQANAKAETKKAKKEAKQDLEDARS
jgi:hypothetical protein